MKYVKMLNLLAAIMAPLMACAGTASAIEVTSSTGETPTFVAASVGHTSLHNAVGTTSCNSTVTGAVTAHGPSSTASGPINKLSFTNCTNGSVHLNAEGFLAQPGTLEFHAVGTTGNATVTWNNAKFATTLFGVECGYTTSGTDIGEVVAGEHAVLKLKATLNRTFGNVFCGSLGNWTGEYKFSHPTGLAFH